jgi:tRNA nucleotidyltransferase/poly(A) polymerase/2'-5' RNA ligase
MSRPDPTSVARRFLLRSARGKAKKDVGHGGLDEWFSGHGGSKGKGEDARWGDWVSISPVERTLKKPDGKTKKIKPGDIVGPCGISSKPEWKEFTNDGKDPLKCMPRQKAYDMPKKERAEVAKGKMRAEKKDKGEGKKPTHTPTFKKKKAKFSGTKIGDGTRAGLFIPLPKELAEKFPSLGDEDDSPSHVTFLYIGDYKEKADQEKLVEVLREALRKWWPGARARLDGLEYFDHHDKDRRVPHVSVDFDKDLSGFKHRVRQELSDAGLEVSDRFPEFRPHVTLAYMPGMDAEWDGPVPEGEWDFDEMEVWGLPELHKIKLGPQASKVASAWLRREAGSAPIKAWHYTNLESPRLFLDKPNKTPGSTWTHLGAQNDPAGWYFYEANFVPTEKHEGAQDREDRLFSERPNVLQAEVHLENPYVPSSKEHQKKLANHFGVPHLSTKDFYRLTDGGGENLTRALQDAGFDGIDSRDLTSQHVGMFRGMGPVVVAFDREQISDAKVVPNPVSSDGGSFSGDFKTFLKERYEGGRKKVPNPNPDTRQKRPEISVNYVLKTWPESTQARQVLKEFEQWKSGGKRVAAAWLDRRVAALSVQSSIHRRNVELMKWLSEVTRKLGVARHTYVVGGAVRNFLIDRPIKDIDVVIDSTRARRDSDWLAKQIARNIPAQTNVTTNQYGVAILTVKGDWMIGNDNLKGEVIEIANARKESYGGAGGKGYKPHSVEPATIEEDLLRREFTFNTLLWRMLDLAKGPDRAEVIDLTGCGVRDLNERKIQCPQDPDRTFSDDPTRMLRAIKFTGKYGFKIPPDVARSIRKNVRKMKRMPWEAVASILVNDVLNQPTARRSLQQMKSLGILEVISEMIQESKPFATYMANQLRRNRKVQFLLDLMELGVPAKTPISFLDRAGQARLRDLTVSMPEKEAVALVEKLIKPPVDSRRVIEVLDLPGPDRRFIVPTARHVILQEPELAAKGQHLTDRVIEELRR